MRWQDKLTKKQKAHLKEVGITTLRGVKQSVEFQNGQRFPCWECVEVGRRLGLEAKLTAFHERAGGLTS